MVGHTIVYTSYSLLANNQYILALFNRSALDLSWNVFIALTAVQYMNFGIKGSIYKRMILVL